MRHAVFRDRQKSHGRCRLLMYLRIFRSNTHVCLLDSRACCRISYHQIDVLYSGRTLIDMACVRSSAFGCSRFAGPVQLVISFSGASLNTPDHSRSVWRLITRHGQ